MIVIIILFVNRKECNAIIPMSNMFLKTLNEFPTESTQSMDTTPIMKHSLFTSF
jgi:hypothetical protein